MLLQSDLYRFLVDWQVRITQERQWVYRSVQVVGHSARGSQRMPLCAVLSALHPKTTHSSFAGVACMRPPTISVLTGRAMALTQESKCYSNAR